MAKPRLVQTDLPEEILEDFLRRDELALDCEMMGLNPHRDRLCVLQIMAEQGPIALMQINEQLEYPNLRRVLESTEIEKIFHFARMDCLFLLKRLGIRVNKVFCTKIASKLARTYTDRHGLKELAREICGVTMDKTNQSSDWGREKLTDDQLYYAEGDIKYLFTIKSTLIEMLKREDRYELALDTLACLPNRIELDARGFGEVFEH